MAREPKVAPWEDVVLRLIAIYKMLHGLFFIGVGVGLVKLKHANYPQVVHDYIIEPFQLSPENKMVDWLLAEASKLTPHKIVLASDAMFFYALLFCIEGVGLFLRKHWAEYFVIIVTASLLPFEVWAMVSGVEWWKAVLILGNLLIVGYLIHRLRLDRRARCAGSKKNEGPVAGGLRVEPPAEHHVGNRRG